ncbi:MAG TPA: XrtA system polysaccharide chain length determinant [Patescibacteria group bacterium]|nr:XrtA system polysaccharide chain length determinant [Patescibacteria group bacterium]
MPTPPTVYDETAKGPGLSGLLEIVRRRRVLAVLPFLFVLTAAVSLAVFLPSLWTARSLVLVNRQVIPERYVTSTVQADLEARLLTLSQEILTPQRLTQIARQYGLYRSARSTDDLVDRMRKDIRIELVEERERRSREGRSFLFTVSYTAANPVVAARVANTLSSLYIEENGRMREQQAASTSEFLEGQLKDLRDKLQNQERTITAYKEKNLGELPEQKDVNLRTLERLQQQLQLAHENNRRATERRQMLTNALGEIDTTVAMTATPSAAGPSVTPADTAAARLNLLRQELAMTQTRFSDKYPDVVQLKEQIRVLEAKVETEKAAAAALPKSVAATTGKRAGRDLRVPPENAYVQSLMTQLDQATVEAKTSAEEIRGINGQIAVYTRRLENTPKREQELAILTRDYDTTKDLFKSLLAKRGEADMAAELEQRQKGENFRVIEPARLPERPAGPNRFRLLLVGLALAIGASGAAVVLAEQVDTSFRRVDEIRSALPLPVLSAIPRITTEQDRSRTLRHRRWATAAVGFGLLIVAGTSFVVAHDNQGLVALLTPSAAPTAATSGR